VFGARLVTEPGFSFYELVLMQDFESIADDFFVNINLYTEMPLPSTRESVLEFFGRVQKSYPQMRNFYTKENGDFVLEEDKDASHYRWVSLEPRRLCSGYVNPTSVDDALEQHTLMLELAPYMLSVSPLDCEALDFLYGFDFMYRGNHDELVAEALGVGGAMDGLLSIPGSRPLNYSPSMTLALDESCRRQCRILIETRTSAYQVRKSQFPEESISVYFTMRQYGSMPHDQGFANTLQEMRTLGEELLKEHVIDDILKPLAHRISMK